MKYIFLDIDGVLNSSDFIKYMQNYKHVTGKNWTDEIDGRSEFVDPRAVQRVIDICEKTGAKIVVSSSWRHYTFDNTISYFQGYVDLVPLIPYITGITPKLSTFSHYAKRGEEIQYFLNHVKDCEKYCIIDDDNDMLDEQLPYFVCTDFEYGLSDTDKDKVIKILK